MNGAPLEARLSLQEHPVTRLNIDSVARLIGDFESAYALELLPTVHWVANREGAATLRWPSKSSTPGALARRCSRDTM
jgi:hypothetical protein